MDKFGYIGIDEVGRGAWAGPAVIAAIFIPRDVKIPRDIIIRDSKVLNRSQRERSAAFLRENSIFFISFVSAGTIDKYGVHRAIALGILRICSKMKAKILANDDISEKTYRRRYKILIDGRSVCDVSEPHEFIVHGDSTRPIISAASIIAKEYRDAYMRRVARLYQDYGFERHVGYGTKEHQEALGKHGVCAIHRRSYAPIRKLCTA